MIDDLIAKVYERVHRKTVDTFSFVVSDPIEALWLAEWDVPVGIQVDQSETARWNVDLDFRGCLGRTARAAVLVERHFPDAELFVGEVWKDGF